ncbi:MAG: altronate dehydratase family protein [Ignavibacteriaceae bacterium]|nr:altronate dehydratase family protein [Ignavibacteriaceae bacterium]
MKVKFIKIHDSDNVVVAVELLTAGEKILPEGIEITLAENINKGHKIAIHDIKAGEKVIKYGHVIGHAVTDMKTGEWVHSHNLKTDLSDVIEYQYNPVKSDVIKSVENIPTFSGYKRKNGKAGTRNEIWIINTVGCVNSSAEKIAKIANEKFKSENFDGVFTFSHPYGCSQLGDDLTNTQRVLAGLINNPNAGAVLILGLGCENNQMGTLLSKIGNADTERIRSFNSQDVTDEIETGVNKIEELFQIIIKDKREEIPLSELVIGVKCGGSDGFSGITANALVGRITDILTSYKGTVLLTEVPEMFGAEQQLMNRAKDKDTFNKIVSMINSFKKYFTDHNQPVYENPSPGNKEGGLTTLEEKSLGAIQKGGTSRITKVLDYGEVFSTDDSNGLVLIKAPGNDGVSSTAMTASGAVMLLFTTGRGTPLGFPVPTVKISSNTDIFNRKPNWIDFNAGRLLDGEENIGNLTGELLKFIIDAASGKIKMKNEINGYKEIAIWKEGVTL